MLDFNPYSPPTEPKAQRQISTLVIWRGVIQMCGWLALVSAIVLGTPSVVPEQAMVRDLISLSMIVTAVACFVVAARIKRRNAPR
jgi:hypothetical protein